jgi:hypothetical protein
MDVARRPEPPRHACPAVEAPGPAGPILATGPDVIHGNHVTDRTDLTSSSYVSVKVNA